jgi:inosose dehydratase
MTLRLANAPCSWGVDYADAADNPPVARVFDGIAAAGYRATELGPYGFAPTEPATLSRLLDERGLALVGGFLFEPFHDPAAHAALEEKAGRLLALLSDVGGRVLVLIDHISEARARTAGRSDVAERLDDTRFAAMAALMARIAERAREHGIAPVIHHHAAGYIEFEDEIDRALGAVTAAGLCLDTGHAAFCGLDPLALADRHAARIAHVHLKDIDRAVRDAAVAEGCGFDEAVSRNVFVPLGRGMVDFPAVAERLGAIGYDGFAVIEQDIDPAMSAPDLPLAAARESLAFLENAHPAYRAR